MMATFMGEGAAELFRNTPQHSEVVLLSLGLVSRDAVMARQAVHWKDLDSKEVVIQDLARKFPGKPMLVVILPEIMSKLSDSLAGQPIQVRIDPAAFGRILNFGPYLDISRLDEIIAGELVWSPKLATTITQARSPPKVTTTQENRRSPSPPETRQKTPLPAIITGGPSTMINQPVVADGHPAVAGIHTNLRCRFLGSCRLQQ